MSNDQDHHNDALQKSLSGDQEQTATPGKSPSNSSSIETLVHLPVPEKPKYTKFKPDTAPFNTTQNGSPIGIQGAVSSEVEAYSPTHFNGDILSPVYRGGQEVVYDPSNPPIPKAARRVGSTEH